MTSFKEAPHPAAFILSEADGQLSRDNVQIAGGQEFPPGTVITNGAGGYVAWTGGAGTLGIAIYGVKTDVGEPVSIAAITRSAEVNRHVIAWPDGFDDAAIDAAATELAKQMIIVRGAPLPSPPPSP
jgi:hypothetical protein